MASKTTLNARNLEALGATRLAALLLELSEGDAAAKRRLRLELAAEAGPSEMARQVRKRLTTIAKSTSFVDWRKQSDFIADLETQREAIAAKIGEADPQQGLELMWRFMALADNAFARCDDSHGRLGDVFRAACEDIGPLALAARSAPQELADRVFEALRENDYGQFDGLIEATAPALGAPGLERLKSRLTAWDEEPIPEPREEDRVVAGRGMGGKIYADQIERTRRRGTVSLGLQQIADQQNDVDAFAAQFDAEARTVPMVAAQIALRLVEAGRAEEALGLLDASDSSRGHLPREWTETRLEALEALGRSEEAQTLRWESFERTLNAADLRAHLKRLPDFEDMEAEERALGIVRQARDLHGALAFLIGWPAHELAADLVISRAEALNGDAYYILGPAAEALEDAHPLAATLLLRAMIGFSLDEARSSRYRHAARHLKTCERLAEEIADFGQVEPHARYVERLRGEHGRKRGFWSLLD